MAMISGSMRAGARLVHERFFTVAAEHADRIALACLLPTGWSEWTYRALLERVREVAVQLQECGVEEGEAVGLSAVRSPDTIAAMIAILQLGANYVPLDPEYPEARLRLLRSTAGIRQAFIPQPGIRRTSLANLPTRLNGETPAYLMFTSGSTGEPKAVIVPHRAILRLVDHPNFMRLDSSRVFLALAPMGFDASTLEIWGPLLNGGTCVLYPDSLLPTASGLKAVIGATGVNCLWLTSSLFNRIIDQDPSCLAGVEDLLTGGEALSVPHVVRALAILNGAQLINGYGPTENTTFTTCHHIPRQFPSSASRVPIGVPISGTRIAVVDAELRPVTPGTEGELLALGEGLALGYLQQPALTRERFIEWSGTGGDAERAYRTGDRVVQGQDGVLEFLGRMDDQVKIDGHRIEPGEIERALARLPGVKDCRVLAPIGPAGQRRLAAYIVSQAEARPGDLRQRLTTTLPSFMVPHFFFFLDALPTNANGKLDQAALPDPFARGALSSAGIPAPEFALVSAAWTEVLGRSAASSDVNFFDAGGTSLEAVQLHELLSQRLGRELNSTFLFEHTTIRRQTEALAAGAVQAESAAGGRGQQRRIAQEERLRRKRE